MKPIWTQLSAVLAEIKTEAENAAKAKVEAEAAAKAAAEAEAAALRTTPK